MGLFSFFAFSKASAPQGYQSTGLCACWRRYGDFSFASRLVCEGASLVAGAAAPITTRAHAMNSTHPRNRATVGMETTVIADATREGAGAMKRGRSSK